jgi:signal transduction histidine kinase
VKFSWQSDESGGAQPQGMEAPGSVAAGIVHDINNELTLALNLLSTGSVTKGDIDAARAAAARCGELTSGLLSYWRTGAVPAPQSTVDAAEVVRELAASLRLPKTVLLMYDAPPGQTVVKAEPAALRRILLNLILNACDAMNNDGMIIVWILSHRIGVQDSGPGIAPEHLPRIFEPFFTTKGSRGTGLGLSVVRQLMEQQGGSVSVDSDSDGTTFELYFRK